MAELMLESLGTSLMAKTGGAALAIGLSKENGVAAALAAGVTQGKSEDEGGLDGDSL